MQIIFTVRQSHCVAIERLGKYNRICRQGLRFRVPFIERFRYVPEWGDVANKGSFEIELTEQQTDTPPRQCHTKDNVTVEANASIYWRILNPVKALYEVDVLPRSISDIALNALRANIGVLELDTILSERQKLNERIAAQLADVGKKWGVQFTRVEIQELRTTDETASAMRQQMEAERRRRAMISEAEGTAAAEIKVAEAHRQAVILRADGQARALDAIGKAELEYLTRLGTALPPAHVARILLAQKYLDGLADITKNPSHKVFLPNSFDGLFTLPIDSEARQGGTASSTGQADSTSDGH